MPSERSEKSKGYQDNGQRDQPICDHPAGQDDASNSCFFVDSEYVEEPELIENDLERHEDVPVDRKDLEHNHLREIDHDGLERQRLLAHPGSFQRSVEDEKKEEKEVHAQDDEN